MAMTMNGEVALNATRETVWAKLNDPDTLKAAIPGCQDLEKIGETAFRATVKLKVGPVGAVFKGAVELVDLDPPNGYRIVGQGEGGVAGFAKGGAKVSLHDVPDNSGMCLLRYDVEADVGGKIAQLGSRLINGVASKTADQFFKNFAAAIQ
jgi:uncharacterized protein